MLQGAVVGLLSGLVVAMLIGFGGPKPAHTPLLLSTEGCSANLTLYAAPRDMASFTPHSQQ